MEILWNYKKIKDLFSYENDIRAGAQEMNRLERWIVLMNQNPEKARHLFGDEVEEEKQLDREIRKQAIKTMRA